MVEGSRDRQRKFEVRGVRKSKRMGPPEQNTQQNTHLLSVKRKVEKGITTHSSILAWRIPWTEELGGLPSMGSQRVGHD